MTARILSTLFLLFLSLFPLSAFGIPKTIITDCGNHYLPKDSLPAIAIAIAQGAETIQLKLAMTQDQTVIVINDTILNDLTNVTKLFPEKIRDDGTFEITDFTLEEVKQLSLRTQSTTKESENLPAEETAVPIIHVTTLPEALGVITIMEQQLGRKIGIVAEIKKSWLHLHNNLDISREVLSIFKQYGFSERDNLYIGSYDPEELQRIHTTLLPESGLRAKTLQLFDTNNGRETMRFERGLWQPYNYDWLLTKFGIKALSSFAEAIGLNLDMAIEPSGSLKLMTYIEDAHMLGLEILAYPFDDPFSDSLPDFANTVEALAEYCLFTAGFDGLITADDKIVREHIDKISRQRSSESSRPKTSIERLLEEVKRQKNQ